MNNIVNQVSFLPTSWEFPANIDRLSLAMTRSYVNISNTVNSRTIGIFSANRPAINGEQWFVQNNLKQQGFRQAYVIPTIASYPYELPHGINLNQIFGFVKIYGTFTDGTNWYPLPFVAVANTDTTQVNILINPNNIVINAGAAAPNFSSGFVVLEWISL